MFKPYPPDIVLYCLTQSQSEQSSKNDIFVREKNEIMWKRSRAQRTIKTWKQFEKINCCINFNFEYEVQDMSHQIYTDPVSYLKRRRPHKKSPAQVHFNEIGYIKFCEHNIFFIKSQLNISALTQPFSYHCILFTHLSPVCLRPWLHQTGGCPTLRNTWYGTHF